MESNPAFDKYSCKLIENKKTIIVETDETDYHKVKHLLLSSNYQLSMRVDLTSAFDQFDCKSEVIEIHE